MPVKKKDDETLGVRDFFKRFSDEAAAVSFFEGKRWPDGAWCPHCVQLVSYPGTFLRWGAIHLKTQVTEPKP